MSKEQHQVRLEVKNGFSRYMRLFRDETKSSKHLFRPSEHIKRTSWLVTQVKSVVVSTCLDWKSHAVRRTMWQVLKALTRQRLATSLRLTCIEVRLVCSEGLEWRFEGFVSPRNCLWIQFWPRVSLGAIPATVRQQTVDDVVESSVQN